MPWSVDWANKVLPEAFNVVNEPVFADVLPIVGGLDKSKVPPNVTVPVLVIGPPVSVIPLTVPFVATEVTTPVRLEPEPLNEVAATELAKVAAEFWSMVKAVT